MNLFKYFSVLTVMAMFSNVYAVDMSNPEADLPGYCNESVALAGIEDAEDKNQYVQDCMQSFGGTMEPQPPTE